VAVNIKARGKRTFVDENIGSLCQFHEGVTGFGVPGIYHYFPSILESVTQGEYAVHSCGTAEPAITTVKCDLPAGFEFGDREVKPAL
jgi:hypothetical protein